MLINPAIDLQGGRSVRLLKGDFKKETIINKTPSNQVDQFIKAKIDRIHLVDLDGARLGKPMNRDLVLETRNKFNGMIELGGGIRDLDTMKFYLENGINRVILGSVAISNPKLVKRAVKKFGSEKIVVGIDGKNGLVSTEGWVKQSKISMESLINDLIKIGVKTFIVTDIEQDGAMKGVNLELLKDLQQKFSKAQIIASGGIRNLSDILALKQANIREVIVGRALFEGTLSLKEVLEVNQNVN